MNVFVNICSSNLVDDICQPHLCVIARLAALNNRTGFLKVISAPESFSCMYCLPTFSDRGYYLDLSLLRHSVSFSLASSAC